MNDWILNQIKKSGVKIEISGVFGVLMFSLILTGTCILAISGYQFGLEKGVDYPNIVGIVFGVVGAWVLIFIRTLIEEVK